MHSLTLELKGFKLANRDLFSKSDPYFVISKQSLAGGWNPLRTSETIRNNLNPEWRQITLLAQELPSEGKKLRFQVYDDDGKLGRDASDHLIGEGFYSIEDLEQAFAARKPLPIHKRDNIRGHLIFTQVLKSMSVPPPSSYPPPKRPSTASPYPFPTGVYPPVVSPELTKEEENQPSRKSSNESSLPSFQAAPYSAGGFVLPGRN